MLTALIRLGAADDTGQVQIGEAQATLISEMRVPAREAGPLSELKVREGDIVEPGAVLAIVEADLAKLQEAAAHSDFDVAQTQAENNVDLRFAEKSLEVAEAELRRATESVRVAPKSISKTEMERLQLVVDRSQLAVEQAQRDQRVAALGALAKKAEWEAAQQHVRRCTLTAPWKGMVVQLLKQSGEWVNPGDPVLRLIRLDRLRVEFFVEGRMSGRKLDGQPVKLTVKSSPNQSLDFDGLIVFVSPEVQPVTGQIRVWAEVDNPRMLLRPGDRGTLTFTEATKESASP